MWWELLKGGIDAVVEYIALHTLTCLLPAFLLAGAMVSFISKEAIIHYLGTSSNRFKVFGLAAIGSFFMAACSCTVIPVASGLYYSGASIGAAFIVLWIAPAANVLSLIYTGNILGLPIMLTRLGLAILMGFIVGWVMSLVFKSEDQTRQKVMETNNPPLNLITKKDGVLLLLIVISLLSPNYLVQRGPYFYKVIVWSIATAVVFIFALRVKTKEEIIRWLTESWWFIRIIFPLLIIGVFIVGIVGKLLPSQWVGNWLGGSGLMACFLATIIGSTTYLATLTEAPLVSTLMKLGMGPAPAVALLLTGPGLSLPNWLAIGRIFGFKKALVYVITIIILGTVGGWLSGILIF